jgi:class 3 adenylate cyclase
MASDGGLDRASPTEVRRSLTSVFIDLVGSTPLSVVLDDEEYSALIDDYRVMVNAAIGRQGGTVQNDEGDGRFVWFGWPIAHRDDADRAVLMSLDVLAGIGPLARRIRGRVDRDLNVRIGIHTGPQIVNLPADGGRPDARGAGVNLAAKVQQHCQPGEVLVTEATVDMLTRPFTLEPHGQLTIDSLAGAIQLFRVAGPGEEPAALGPFAGRRTELDLLDDLWARARAGGTASAVLFAPAGLGKSRLIAELCARSEIPTLIHSVGDQRRIEDPLHALMEGLVHSGLVASEAGPLTTEGVVDVVRTSAAGGPTLFVVDDAQWLDASSIDVVTELASNCPPNLMVLVASRPDAASARWSEVGETIRLAPLDPSTAASLLETIDGSGTLSETTRATIIDRGGGNPLFLHWLAKSSNSDNDFEGVRRILRPRSGVPVVIQHVLRSVLDDTGVDDMTTSTAAAIGTKFDAALLAAVLDRPGETVEADLRKLAAREIIRRGDLGQRSYQFSHSLIRDLAYDLLVPSECLRRHARIADTLEAQQSTDHALIGYHHDRAGRAERAARSKLSAARLCRTTGAYREGAALTARAIELMTADFPDVTLRLEADDLNHLFATVTQPGAYVAGVRSPPTELRAALTADHRDRWACIDKTSQWAAACMMGDLRQSASLLYDVYRIGLRSYPEIVPFNQCARGYHATLRGRFAHAELLLRRSAERMLEVGVDPWMASHWPVPDDPMAISLAYLPTALLQRGYRRSGIEWMRRAWQRAETLENGAYSMAHISSNSGLFWAMLGDGDAVVEHGRDMTRLGIELEARLWTTLGGIYEQVGETIADPTVERVQAVTQLATAFEGMSGPLSTMLYLYSAQGALATGQIELAVSALDGLARLSEKHGLQQYDAEALRLRAATGSGASRTKMLIAAADLAGLQGARRYRLKALTDLAEHDPLVAVAGTTAGRALESAIEEVSEWEEDPDVLRGAAAFAQATR